MGSSLLDLYNPIQIPDDIGEDAKEALEQINALISNINDMHNLPYAASSEDVVRRGDVFKEHRVAEAGRRVMQGINISLAKIKFDRRVLSMGIDNNQDAFIEKYVNAHDDNTVANLRRLRAQDWYCWKLQYEQFRFNRTRDGMMIPEIEKRDDAGLKKIWQSITGGTDTKGSFIEWARNKKERISDYLDSLIGFEPVDDPNEAMSEQIFRWISNKQDQEFEEIQKKVLLQRQKRFLTKPLRKLERKQGDDAKKKYLQDLLARIEILNDSSLSKEILNAWADETINSGLWRGFKQLFGTDKKTSLADLEQDIRAKLDDIILRERGLSGLAQQWEQVGQQGLKAQRELCRELEAEFLKAKVDDKQKAFSRWAYSHQKYCEQLDIKIQQYSVRADHFNQAKSKSKDHIKALSKPETKEQIAAFKRVYELHVNLFGDSDLSHSCRDNYNKYKSSSSDSVFLTNTDNAFQGWVETCYEKETSDAVAKDWGAITKPFWKERAKYLLDFYVNDAFKAYQEVYSLYCSKRNKEEEKFYRNPLKGFSAFEESKDLQGLRNELVRLARIVKFRTDQVNEYTNNSNYVAQYFGEVLDSHFNADVLREEKLSYDQLVAVPTGVTGALFDLGAGGDDDNCREFEGQREIWGRVLSGIKRVEQNERQWMPHAQYAHLDDRCFAAVDLLTEELEYQVDQLNSQQAYTQLLDPLKNKLERDKGDIRRSKFERVRCGDQGIVEAATEVQESDYIYHDATLITTAINGCGRQKGTVLHKFGQEHQLEECEKRKVGKDVCLPSDLFGLHEQKTRLFFRKKNVPDLVEAFDKFKKAIKSDHHDFRGPTAHELFRNSLGDAGKAIRQRKKQGLVLDNQTINSREYRVPTGIDLSKAKRFRKELRKHNLVDAFVKINEKITKLESINLDAFGPGDDLSDARNAYCDLQFYLDKVESTLSKSIPSGFLRKLGYSASGSVLDEMKQRFSSIRESLKSKGNKISELNAAYIDKKKESLETVKQHELLAIKRFESMFAYKPNFSTFDYRSYFVAEIAQNISKYIMRDGLFCAPDFDKLEHLYLSVREHLKVTDQDQLDNLYNCLIFKGGNYEDLRLNIQILRNQETTDKFVGEELFEKYFKQVYQSMPVKTEEKLHSYLTQAKRSLDLKEEHDEYIAINQNAASKLQEFICHEGKPLPVDGEFPVDSHTTINRRDSNGDDSDVIHIKSYDDILKLARALASREHNLANVNDRLATYIQGKANLTSAETYHELLEVLARATGDYSVVRDAAAKRFENLLDSGQFNPKPTDLESFEFMPVPGDGHCLYHAASLYLGLDHRVLRQHVARKLRDNESEYRQFVVLPEGQSYNDYVDAVENGNEWATEVEITALMHVLNRPIVVIGPDQKVRNKDCLDQFSGEPIFVRYNGYNHYDGLALKESVSDPRLLAINIAGESEETYNAVDDLLHANDLKLINFARNNDDDGCGFTQSINKILLTKLKNESYRFENIRDFVGVVANYGDAVAQSEMLRRVININSSSEKVVNEAFLIFVQLRDQLSAEEQKKLFEACQPWINMAIDRLESVDNEIFTLIDKVVSIFGSVETQALLLTRYIEITKGDSSIDFILSKIHQDVPVQYVEELNPHLLKFVASMRPDNAWRVLEQYTSALNEAGFDDIVDKNKVDLNKAREKYIEHCLTNHIDVEYDFLLNVNNGCLDNLNNIKAFDDAAEWNPVLQLALSLQFNKDAALSYLQDQRAEWFDAAIEGNIDFPGNAAHIIFLGNVDDLLDEDAAGVIDADKLKAFFGEGNIENVLNHVKNYMGNRFSEVGYSSADDGFESGILQIVCAIVSGSDGSYDEEFESLRKLIGGHDLCKQVVVHLNDADLDVEGLNAAYDNFARKSSGDVHYQYYLLRILSQCQEYLRNNEPSKDLVAFFKKFSAALDESGLQQERQQLDMMLRMQSSQRRVIDRVRDDVNVVKQYNVYELKTLLLFASNSEREEIRRSISAHVDSDEQELFAALSNALSPVSAAYVSMNNNDKLFDEFSKISLRECLVEQFERLVARMEEQGLDVSSIHKTKVANAQGQLSIAEINTMNNIAKGNKQLSTLIAKLRQRFIFAESNSNNDLSQNENFVLKMLANVHDKSAADFKLLLNQLILIIEEKPSREFMLEISQHITSFVAQAGEYHSDEFTRELLRLGLIDRLLKIASDENLHLQPLNKLKNQAETIVFVQARIKAIVREIDVEIIPEPPVPLDDVILQKYNDSIRKAKHDMVSDKLQALNGLIFDLFDMNLSSEDFKEGLSKLDEALIYNDIIVNARDCLGNDQRFVYKLLPFLSSETKYSIVLESGNEILLDSDMIDVLQRCYHKLMENLSHYIAEFSGMEAALVDVVLRLGQLLGITDSNSSILALIKKTNNVGAVVAFNKGSDDPDLKLLVRSLEHQSNRFINLFDLNELRLDDALNFWKENLPDISSSLSSVELNFDEFVNMDDQALVERLVQLGAGSHSSTDEVFKRKLGFLIVLKQKIVSLVEDDTQSFSKKLRSLKALMDKIVGMLSRMHVKFPSFHQDVSTARLVATFTGESNSLTESKETRTFVDYIFACQAKLNRIIDSYGDEENLKATIEKATNSLFDSIAMTSRYDAKQHKQVVDKANDLYTLSKIIAKSCLDDYVARFNDFEEGSVGAHLFQDFLTKSSASKPSAQGSSASQEVSQNPTVRPDGSISRPSVF